MKPQSLQDAIKAKALRKEQVRQENGWKEPYVKKYEITAADLVKSSPAQAPALASPMYATSAPAVLPTPDVSAIKKMMQDMQSELKQQRMDIAALQKENKELKEALQSVQQQLQQQQQTQQSTTTASSSDHNTTPLEEPCSPKKAKQPASPAPHSIEDLAEAQRLDKAMRHFMRTQEGLYDAKYMTIREETDGRLICFKNKIYIPLQLRDKTIRYYKSEHATESLALAAMRKNCCWPDLEKDFFDHKP
jgi:DNA repair exonuclease SbcCD ATPase subunit